MPKEKPGKRYTPAITQQVVETMREAHPSWLETSCGYEVPPGRITSWERIYPEESPEMSAIEQSERKSTGCPRKSSKGAEEGLIAENRRLRAETAYLKNLQVLVLERAGPAPKKPTVWKLKRKHSHRLFC